jgi:hypothetical protein
MKKTFPVFLAVVAVVLVFSCASTPPAESGSSAPAAPPANPNLPSFVLNPPVAEDVIYGIGSAKLANQSQAMQTADARGRTAIAFTLNANVEAMIIDYSRTAGNENSQQSLQFIENISRQVTQVKLQGATVVQREQTPDGTFWALVQVKKADAAQAAADIIESEASRYAEFKAMDALNMMENQLARNDVRPATVSE